MTKFILTKKALTEAIKKVVPAVPKKAIKPILQGVRISVSNDFVMLKATDMETSIATTVKTLHTEGTGAFVVNAVTLTDISKNLLDGDVEIQYDGTTATACTGKGKIKIPVMPETDYPELTFGEEGREIKIPTAIALEMINDTAFAASSDEMFRNLNAVQWEITPEQITLITADSYRLAVSTKTTKTADENSNFLIPLKSMKIIEKALKTTKEENVEFLFSNDRITLYDGNTQYSIRLLDVTFPNWKAVMPNQFECEVTADKTELIKSIKLIKVLIDQKGGTVRFNITADGFNIEGSSQDAGEGNIPIASAKTKGEVYTAFDPKYLIEGLQHIEGEVAHLKIVDESNAMEITGENKDKKQIIMPVKIRR